MFTWYLIEFQSSTTPSRFHTECLYSFTWYHIEFHSGTTSSRYHTEYQHSFTRYSIKFHSVTTSSRFHTEYLYSFTWYQLKFHSGTSHSRAPEFILVVAPDRNFCSRTKICPHVPQISCKGGTSSFRYRIMLVDWLGWSFDSCFRSADAFTALSFQNENFYVNVKRTAIWVILEWNSFRYHENTT